MEEYHIYATDPDCESWYVDLSLAEQSMQECGYDLDSTIYVFTCAEGWQQKPDGSMIWGNPEGFESRLVRTMTLAEAIRETDET